MPVCRKCHDGIHLTLIPGSSHWIKIQRRVITIQNKIEWRLFQHDVIQFTIIDRLDDILKYKEFLEFKAWKNQMGYTL